MKHYNLYSAVGDGIVEMSGLAFRRALKLPDPKLKYDQNKIRPADH